MKQNQTETINVDLSAFEKNQIMASALNTAYARNLPMAVWRLPNQNEINLMVSFENVRQIERIDLQELPKGFLFSPFDHSERKSLFIKSDIHLSFDFEEVVIHPTEEGAFEAQQTSFLQDVSEGISSEKAPQFHIKPLANSNTISYTNLVEAGVEAIKSGAFEKVVPARTKQIKLQSGFNIISQFMALCQKYPNAFVSIVSTPESGTWMGATPELLLGVDGDIFHTVSLAGTQRRDPEKPLSETAWMQKEIEEQALVSRYIINCFKKIRLREYEERGPKTAVAGNLLHLKTEFKVDMKSTNFPELGTIMLELLHPTSAVAGMPKDSALAFLKENEGFDREYYAGFLGPVQNEGKTQVFVNLRCMQLLNNSAILYAGAGVTQDSNPQKELEETELKFNTLLSLLNPEN